MKCMYYLAPTLSSTSAVSDDLHALGLKDLYLHVIARDQAGLDQQHIDTGNYLETLDLIPDGLIGASLGFLAGAAGIGLLLYFQPFGPDVPAFAFLLILAAATLCGAWEGGLVGIGSENRKIAQFHDELEAGKYLILAYVGEADEAVVRRAMRQRHADARLVGIDAHYMNPFSAVQQVSEA